MLLTDVVMQEKGRKYRVFVSVAEPSADVHCANLISAARRMGYDDIEFVGVGGPKMAEAGCELLEATVGKAVMIYKAFAAVGYFYLLLRRMKRYLKSNKVDLVIVCDSPSLNWHVAKFAKKRGIKTLFYVAPQLWAWAGWRIRKLRKYCDKLCCILPFEQEWFSRRGMDVVFVGNPMLESPESKRGRRKEYADFEPKNVRVALMPGSRKAELKLLWRPMQEIALRLKGKYPGARFVTVAVDEERQKALEQEQIAGFECEYTIGSVSETADAVDFAVVASGSATLQVAGVGCPMVIMYQSSRILWHLAGRWVVKSKYLSLVNILAEREMVPEFMPYFVSIEPVAESIEGFLEDRDKLAQVSGELIELTRPSAEKEPGEEVARVVAEMVR